MFHGKANSEQGTHEPSISSMTEDAAVQQGEMQLYLAAANNSSILGQSLLTSF